MEKNLRRIKVFKEVLDDKGRLVDEREAYYESKEYFEALGFDDVLNIDAEMYLNDLLYSNIICDDPFDQSEQLIESIFKRTGSLIQTTIIAFDEDGDFIEEDSCSVSKDEFAEMINAYVNQ